MFQKERTALGEDYRQNRKRKIKEVFTIKPEKKQRQKKLKPPRAPIKEKANFLCEISVVIEDLKDIEIEIRVKEEEVNLMKSVKQSSTVELAVEKTKLKMKAENSVLLNEKLCNLQKLHRNCKISN